MNELEKLHKLVYAIALVNDIYHSVNEWKSKRYKPISLAKDLKAAEEIILWKSLALLLGDKY